MAAFSVCLEISARLWIHFKLYESLWTEVDFSTFCVIFPVWCITAVSHLIHSFNISSFIGPVVWLIDWWVKSKGYWCRTSFIQWSLGVIVLFQIFIFSVYGTEFQNRLTFVWFPQLGTQKYHSGNASVSTWADMMQTDASNWRKGAFRIIANMYWRIMICICDWGTHEEDFWDIQGEIAGDFFFPEFCCWSRYHVIDHHKKMMNQNYHRATASLFSERLPSFSGKLLNSQTFIILGLPHSTSNRIQ